MIAVSFGTNGFITTRAVNERPTNAVTVLSNVRSVEVDRMGGAGAATGGGVGAGIGGGVGAGAGGGGVCAEAVAGTASARSSARPAVLIGPPWPAAPARCRRR